MLGTDPGVTAALNGGTHMPFEDVALYRTIPTAIIFDPTDMVQLEDVLRQSKDLPGVKYIRVGRKDLAKVYEPGTHFMYNTYGTFMLSAIVQKVTGKKLVDYLQEVRMEHAVRLIREDKLTNEQICEAVGYSRLQYFSAKFKEYYGVSLNDFRRRCRSGEDEPPANTAH